MKLYIGNATNGLLDFSYRLPAAGGGFSGVRSQKIEMGQQVEITGHLTGDLQSADIDLILKQYEKYGLVKIEEVSKEKRFRGICYSVDKPISARNLHALMEMNHQALVEEGVVIRRQAAIAEHNRLEHALSEQPTPGRLNDFEMTIIQDNYDERDVLNVPLAEEVHVSRTAPEAPPTATQGRATRRASRSRAA